MVPKMSILKVLNSRESQGAFGHSYRTSCKASEPIHPSGLFPTMRSLEFSLLVYFWMKDNLIQWEWKHRRHSEMIGLEQNCPAGYRNVKMSIHPFRCRNGERQRRKLGKLESRNWTKNVLKTSSRDRLILRPKYLALRARTVTMMLVQ